MLGAGIGYYMAERIADPVNRLMRATAPHRARRSRRAHPRDLVRRVPAAGRSLQPDGRRSAAPARRARAHQPPGGVGRHGAAGRARHQEPADADSAERRAPAARARRSGPAARAACSTNASSNILGQVRLLRQIASRVLELRVVARRRGRSPTTLAELVERGGRAVSHRAWPAASTIERDVPADAAAAADRSHADRPRADQHHRERAARDAGRRHADGRRRARAGPARCSCASPIPASAWIAEALARIFEPYFSTQGDRHRPRTDDREAQRRS